MTGLLRRRRKEAVGPDLALTAICGLLVLPLYVVVINAFKANDDIVRDPLGLPIGRLSASNLEAALSSTSVNLVEAYARTALITGLSVAILVTFASMLAYPIARVRGPAGLLLYVVVAAGLFVPGHVVLIPAIKVLAGLGLLFTPQGLIAYNVAGGMPFATLVFVAATRTIPRELDEAVLVDGGSRWQTFWHVILPLSIPAIAVVALFTGMSMWTDYISPNVILSPYGEFTVTTGLVRAVGKYGTDYELLFGWLFLVMIPVLVVFVFLQRYFVSGLTAGAVKR